MGMALRGLMAAMIASMMLLTGCAVASEAQPSVVPSAVPTPDSTPSPTATASPGPSLVDPASYPLPAEELGQGMKGVMFTAGGTGLQCAIFDPIAPDNHFATPPEFGCVVSVIGYPYPPMVGGPMDSANAFLSWSHEAAVGTDVTDATYSGDTPAPALPSGASIAWSTVTCTALAADEVRCVDSTSGHGMRVSVRDYDLF